MRVAHELNSVHNLGLFKKLLWVQLEYNCLRLINRITVLDSFGNKLQILYS